MLVCVCVCVCVNSTDYHAKKTLYFLWKKKKRIEKFSFLYLQIYIINQSIAITLIFKFRDTYIADGIIWLPAKNMKNQNSK